MSNIDFQNGYIAGLASRGKFIERVVQPTLSCKGDFVEIIPMVDEQIADAIMSNTILNIETTATLVE